MALDEADLKTLTDIQMHASLYADLIVDMIKKEKLESMAVTLGGIHNAMRAAAGRAQQAVDIARYLEKQDVT